MDGDRMIEDTSGFYKYESGQLHYGPNFVYDTQFTLRREKVVDYGNEEIIDGWYWFDSIENAHIFFEIPISFVTSNAIIE